VSALTAVPAAEFHGEGADYRACMLERHQAAAPAFAITGVGNEFVRGVLHDYQDYWWHAMANPSQRAQLEADLLKRLRVRLALAAADAEDMDAL
jgi:hypothetical protein